MPVLALCSGLLPCVCGVLKGPSVGLEDLSIHRVHRSDNLRALLEQALVDLVAEQAKREDPNARLAAR
jgi:hypothetical protein